MIKEQLKFAFLTRADAVAYTARIKKLKLSAT